jgi:hypothetical protein
MQYSHLSLVENICSKIRKQSNSDVGLRKAGGKMKQRERVQPRFQIGERILINSTIYSGLAGQRGVVRRVIESRHAHTLDKYSIQVDGREEEIALWDIQLSKEKLILQIVPL